MKPSTLRSRSAASRGLGRLGILTWAFLIFWTASAGDPVGEPIAPPDPDLSGMEPEVAELLADTREALLAEPDSVEAWGNLGAVYNAHLLYDDAEVCYRRAARLAPDDFRWAYFLAVVRDVNGAEQPELAQRFDAAAALDPDYPALHFRKGHALTLRGLYEEARPCFERTIELDPDYAIAYRGLGQTLLALGEVEQALEKLERAAEMNPEDGALYTSLVQAYQRLGRIDEAREAAKHAKQFKPDNDIRDPIMARYVSIRGRSARHHGDLADMLLAHEEWDRAIQVLEAMERIRPDYPYVYYAMGAAHARAGRADEARENLDRALELDPDHAFARFELAMLQEQAGQLEQALENCRHAREFEPRESAILIALSRLLSKQGEYEAAIEVYEELELLITLEPHLQSNWGNALMRTGKPEEALERYEAALRLDPTSANAHYNLGVALERLGRKDEALGHYREAVRLDPEHRAARRLTPS